MKQQNKTVARSTSQIQLKQTISSSPLPPPEHLDYYNNIYPDAAKIIFEMALTQHHHRINIENEVINSQIKQSSRGQIFGFILGLIGIMASTYLINNNHDISGSIFGGTSLIALVSTFYNSKKEQKKNLDKKNVFDK